MIDVLRALFNREKAVQSEQTEDVAKLSDHIVVSLPPQIREEFISKLPFVVSTYEGFNNLFKRGRKIIKIFSPFVDPTFTGFVQNVKCPVKIITTCDEKRGIKGNCYLERCATDREIFVRYIVQRKSKMHMFQMHAKLILVDSNLAYIGSANLTDTSIHYNFELGVTVSDHNTICTLDKMLAVLHERI